MKGRHHFYLFQRLRASHHVETLGLVVAGCGDNTPCLQDLLQFFILHRAGIKEALRVTIFGKLHKCHDCIILSFYPVPILT